MRPDEKPDAHSAEEKVTATTSKDINEVHVHHPVIDSQAVAFESAQGNEVQPEESPKENDMYRAEAARTEKERDELRDQLLRKIAEFENYRKRTEREKEQLLLYATERMFSKLVEVLDDLQAALEAGRRSEDYTSMLSGLELIYNKAHRIYEEHGVKPLHAEEGSPFSVDVHEALMHIPHPDIPEGQVVQQIQRGYTFRDKVLRHAKVVTSAGDSGGNAG